MPAPKLISCTPEDGEFYLHHGYVRVFAPISLTDVEGEKLSSEIGDAIELGLDALKSSIEEKYPNVRVGYNV